MKKKLYVTATAILLLIAPLVAGADEISSAETLPCPADQTAETASTSPTESGASESTEVTSEETPDTSSPETPLNITSPPEAAVVAQMPPATATSTQTEINAAPNTDPAPEASLPIPPRPTHYPAGAVILTELYPSPPTGAAEWVELWNATNVTIDLAGFAITDAGGARTTFEGSMAPGEYFLISNPKGKLNNDGDIITLFDATGAQLDAASYANGIDRTESWARSGAVWFVTATPTPLGPNIISDVSESMATTATARASTEPANPSPASPASETTASPNPPPLTPPLTSSVEPIAESLPTPEASPTTIAVAAAPEAIRLENEKAVASVTTLNETKSAGAETSPSTVATVREVTLADARNLKAGAVIRTQGIVSAPSGLFGASTFYVAGSGIRVSLFGVNAPELTIGDVVTLEGKLGSTQGERRLAISKPEGIAVVAHGDAPSPHNISIGEIGDETEGWLVITEGVVIQKLDDRFILDDGAGTVPVVIYEAAHIDMANIGIGNALRVTGIVSETNTGFRLLPRGPEDITVTVQTAPLAVSGSTRQHISSLSILAGLCAAGLLVMVVRKQILNRQKPIVLKRPLVM